MPAKAARKTGFRVVQQGGEGAANAGEQRAGNADMQAQLEISKRCRDIFGKFGDAVGTDPAYIGDLEEKPERLNQIAVICDEMWAAVEDAVAALPQDRLDQIHRLVSSMIRDMGELRTAVSSFAQRGSPERQAVDQALDSLKEARGEMGG